MMNTDDVHEEFQRRRAEDTVIVTGRSVMLFTERSGETNLDEAGPEDKD
jgi:hypothetical protein